MLYDFSLLLDPVLMQLPTRFEAVAISAERMTFEGEEYAVLMLPNMDKFVDKKALLFEPTIAKIVTEQVAFGVKPKMPVRCHRHTTRLEPPPAAVVDANAVIIERAAKNRFRQSTLANG